MELDFLYVPSVNVAADAAYWVNVLGARPRFPLLKEWERGSRCSN